MEKINDLSIIRKDKPYIRRNEKLIFEEITPDKVHDDFDKLKIIFKKYSKFYDFLINVISPVFLDNGLKIFLNTHVNKHKLAINIGSGNSNISEEVVNIDFIDYENVDIVCDIHDLPFNDNSVDVVLNITVLEHVSSPQKVIDEIHRVLKPGGMIFTAYPFIQGFHASPNDYTRLTEEGIKLLHKNFKAIETKPFGGPTSGMLWILQEWFALLFSFGSSKLHLLIYILVMLLTFPLKFLDLILIKHPKANLITSGFIYIGKK
jgi:SAM-dependent methyltransferase